MGNNLAGFFSPGPGPTYAPDMADYYRNQAMNRVPLDGAISKVPNTDNPEDGLFGFARYDPPGPGVRLAVPLSSMRWNQDHIRNGAQSSNVEYAPSSSAVAQGSGTSNDIYKMVQNVLWELFRPPTE